MLDFTAANKKLAFIQQEHLLEGWKELSANQQQHLLKQIDDLDTTLFQRQKELFSEREKPFSYDFEPFTCHDKAQNNKSVGQQLITEGKVGCLLIAGGQGSRLNLSGPKGKVPVSVVRHKSLFQLFAEKVVAAGKLADRHLPLAIMTSPLNHEETIQFFEEHDLFGLYPDRLDFFCQEMLPLLDTQGNLFLDDVDSIARGANGNGMSLHHFVSSGVWEKWSQQSVQYLNYVLIDNPLADPFDAELMGYHHRQGNDITIKSTERRNPEEKVGVLVKAESHVRVVEYSELPDDKKSLDYPCANISLFCFNMDFIKTASDQPLPMHLAFKSVNALTPDGNIEKTFAWKFETFIFDVLLYTRKVGTLQYPRERCFAPLKNLKGEDSLETVQAALQYLDRETIREITELEPPTHPFELAQDFHYPTPPLKMFWERRSLGKESYVSATIPL